jgi:tRNA dimethylallyltransferase
LTLFVIGGATATGKTALAIRLAQYLQTEIVSADSRQFYREMSIGTAKPTAAELAAVPHHFVNSLSVADDYSVGNFEKDALAVLDRIFRQHQYAILTGGSGLFLRAVCEGLDAFPEVSEAVRQQVECLWQERGLAGMQQQLQALDPVHFARIDPHNPARLRRALEVCLQSGQPYSSFLGASPAARPFDIRYLLLECPRLLLYQRIDARVDAMIAAGLEAEARALLPWRHRPALKTVGYEEFFACFDGLISRETAIEKIKQHSRNYAKRQATWFRKYGHWETVAPDITALALVNNSIF